MKAIQTTYRPATNYTGSRILARAEGVPSLTLPYPHELNSDAAHRLAATLLAEKYGWLNSCDLVSGGLPTGDVAHVLYLLP
jgi:hypothetical protein